VQVAAALLALQAIPGAAASMDQQQQEQPPEPCEVPQLGPELERLLQPPSSNAKELYGLWQQGVPLEALGNMHSGSMPVSAVDADCLMRGRGGAAGQTPVGVG
jgi:hypothetical protein